MRLADMPVITCPPVVLRPFGERDAGLVQSAAVDELIPLITTVPATADLGDARASASSRWGLSLPGLHRIELCVEPWNEGAWRAAERAGYHREGLLRSWQRPALAAPAAQ